MRQNRKYQNFTQSVVRFDSSLLHSPQFKAQIIQNTHVLFIYSIYLTTIPRSRSFDTHISLEILCKSHQLLSYLFERHQSLFPDQLSSLSLCSFLLGLAYQILSIIDYPFIGLVESHEFLLDLILLIVALYLELVWMAFQCASAISLSKLEVRTILLEMQQLVAVAYLEHWLIFQESCLKFDNQIPSDILYTSLRKFQNSPSTFIIRFPFPIPKLYIISLYTHYLYSEIN